MFDMQSVASVQWQFAQRAGSIWEVTIEGLLILGIDAPKGLPLTYKTFYLFKFFKHCDSCLCPRFWVVFN